MSWIALDDEVGAIVHLLTSDVVGPVNLTAPNPVRNAELADAIGDVLHRPTVLPVPAFGPKLVLGGERAEALLFEGQRVLPQVLLADGYALRHPTLERGAARRPRTADHRRRRAHEPVETPAQRASSAARSSGSRPA